MQDWKGQLLTDHPIKLTIFLILMFLIMLGSRANQTSRKGDEIP